MPAIRSVLDHIPSLSPVVDAHNSATEPRSSQGIEIDIQFILNAQAQISQHYVAHKGKTLIIVDTGHSIPIGLDLLKEGYHVEWCHTAPLESPQSNPSSWRLTAQLRHFVDRLPESFPSPEKGTVLLADAHLNDVKEAIHSKLPDYATLTSEGYDHVLFLTEAKFCASYEGYNAERVLPKHFITSCKEQGISLSFKGCDFDRPAFFDERRRAREEHLKFRVRAEQQEEVMQRRSVIPLSIIEKLDPPTKAQLLLQYFSMFSSNQGRANEEPKKQPMLAIEWHP